MAVVDSLLNLMAAQRADGLLILADEAPRLLYGDEERPLSMPPIPTATVEEFAREVRTSGGEADDDPGAGAWYKTAAGGDFEVRVEGAQETLRLLFRPSNFQFQRPRDEPVIQLPTSGTRSQDPPMTASEGSQPLASNAPLLDWLSQRESEQASDLILSSGAPARVRRGGILRELPGPPLSDRQILALFEPAMSPAARERLDTRGSVDLPLEIDAEGRTQRFRVNVFKQQRGLAAALRPIRADPPTLADLNLPDQLYELAEFRDGLVLVTGPTGSGKSTTLAALVEHLNRSSERHVITLEDPIELLYPPGRCASRPSRSCVSRRASRPRFAKASSTRSRPRSRPVATTEWCHLSEIWQSCCGPGESTPPPPGQRPTMSACWSIWPATSVRHPLRHTPLPRARPALDAQGRSGLP